MLDFQPIDLARRAEYDQFLYGCGRGCEFNFTNIYLWGRQCAAFHEGNLALFSQFNRKSVYPFPLGQNLKPTLDAIIHDAKMRGIPCRLTGLSQEDCALLERLYPGRFRIHFDRDGFDYVYDIQDLADLKGRAYPKKAQPHQPVSADSPRLRHRTHPPGKYRRNQADAPALVHPAKAFRSFV